MARFKCTAIFSSATNVSDTNSPTRRTGGWSETFYYNGSFEAALSAFQQGANSFCATRAALLPTGCGIIGQRYQQTSPVGPSATRSQLFPGRTATPADVPQMALLCSVPGVGVPNVRPMTLRGIPDEYVVEGEFSPSRPYSDALKKFFNSGLTNLYFKGKDKTQPKIDIATVTAGQVVTTVLPHGLAVGDSVLIAKNKVTASGNTQKAIGLVVSVTSATIFTTESLNLFAGTGGYAQKQIVIYVQVDPPNVQFSRIVVRKVGRPFVQYRGRRGKLPRLAPPV